jgi:hypothetical protein
MSRKVERFEDLIAWEKAMGFDVGGLRAKVATQRKAPTR